MSFTPPGFPPMPPQPNGQQAGPSYVPPPPPPMPGMPMPGMPPQVAPQQTMMPPMPGMGQAPQGFPQPGFPQQAAPPQPPQPPMPPMPPQPQGFPQQMAPQQGFPQQPPGFPPQAQPPQMPQQSQQGGAMAAPTKADPTRVWGQAGKREDGTQRNRRTKEELAEDAAYDAWRQAGGDPNVGMGQALAPQPQQPQQPTPGPQTVVQPIMTAPPNPFGNQAPQMPGFPSAGGGLPPMPQMGAPQAPPQQVQQPVAGQAPSINLDDVLSELNQLRKDNSLLKTGLAQLLRIMYQKPGEPDLYLVLTEVCNVRPQ